MDKDDLDVDVVELIELDDDVDADEPDSSPPPFFFLLFFSSSLAFILKSTTK